MREAFWEMYDESATSENASIRARLTYTWRRRFTLPVLSAMVALISMGHARLRSRCRLSSSGISSSLGAMFSNSLACDTMCSTSGMLMCRRRCSSKISIEACLM